MLIRIALGLILVAVGVGIAWVNKLLQPIPALNKVSTPFTMPLNTAHALNVHLEGTVPIYQLPVYPRQAKQP